MKTVKKLLSLCLCIILLIGTAFSAGAVTTSDFYITTTKVYNVVPGQRTSFEVTVGDFSKLDTADGGYQIEIELPEVLSFISVEQDGRVLSQAEDEYGFYNDNVIILTDYFNLSLDTDAKNEIKWKINVMVNASADIGYYSLGFYTPPMITDGNGNIMDITINNGAIVIGVDEQNLTGDTDGDGAVLAADLIPMRKELLKIENLEFSKNNADMDSDGKISLKDLVALKKLLINDFVVFNDSVISAGA